MTCQPQKLARTCDIASLHNIESIGLKTIFYFLYGNKRDHTLVMDLTFVTG